MGEGRVRGLRHIPLVSQGLPQVQAWSWGYGRSSEALRRKAHRSHPLNNAGRASGERENFQGAESWGQRWTANRILSSEGAIGGRKLAARL